MKVFVEVNPIFHAEIRYVFLVFEKHFDIRLTFVDAPNDAEFIINTSGASNLPIALEFYQSIRQGRCEHSLHFKGDWHIKTSGGAIDYVATAFYMINSLQEYGSNDTDELGRFKYANSYQHKYQIPLRNHVSACLQEIHKVLFPGKPFTERKSRVFLTHDIDTVYGSLLQDSFYLIKKLRPLPILRIILNAVLQKPDWLNMDKIMSIEDEYSLKSTFFWLVQKGRVSNKIANSDYDIKSDLILKALKSVESRGFENGLHKGISSDTFKTELTKLGIPVSANRNHYLKLSLPGHYEQIEESGLRLDTTFGFAEHHGFRNSYGLPFTPFNLKTRKRFSFVEAPLTIMDGTFQKYLGRSKSETARCIMEFIDENKVNSVITILWHNTFFTPYKFGGYLELYKQLLAYLKEADIRGTTSREIIQEYNSSHDLH